MGGHASGLRKQDLSLAVFARLLLRLIKLERRLLQGDRTELAVMNTRCGFVWNFFKTRGSHYCAAVESRGGSFVIALIQ
jgi:hypothetical protein